MIGKIRFIQIIEEGERNSNVLNERMPWKSWTRVTRGGGGELRFSLKFPASHEGGEKRKLRNTLRNKNLRTYVGGVGGRCNKKI